jgi:hypothetical protein
LQSDERHESDARYTNGGYAEHTQYGNSSPSSPNSGRYREGSFGHASGIESGRASTIGTEHGAIPYNSSRVALNNDWRTSYDQGSDLGRGMSFAEIAPGKEGYGSANSQYGDEIEKQRLDKGGNMGQNYAPLPPSSPAIGMDEKRPFPGSAREPPAVVISRTNRLAWIDGLRGIASLIIFTHHFSDLTFSTAYPNVLAVGSLEGFLR